MGKEAKTLLKKLAAQLALALKSEKPYSEVCGFVNAQMSIVIVRATHRCLRGSRIPVSLAIASTAPTALCVLRRQLRQSVEPTFDSA
jgi:hypothetical protein